MAAEASAGGCASSTCAGDNFPPDPYERFTATFSRLL